MSIYRVRAVTSGWVGAPGLTTFYFQTIADPQFSSLAGAQALAARVRLYFEGAKGLVPGSWVAQVNGTVDMLNESNGELTQSWAIAPPAFTQGTGAVGYLPLATALNVALNTESVVGGHRVRGRSFFGPVGGVGENDGSPAPAAITTLENAAASLTSQADGFGALEDDVPVAVDQQHELRHPIAPSPFHTSEVTRSPR